jgi:hypothetical protein
MIVPISVSSFKWKTGLKKLLMVCILKAFGVKSLSVHKQTERYKEKEKSDRELQQLKATVRASLIEFEDLILDVRRILGFGFVHFSSTVLRAKSVRSSPYLPNRAILYLFSTRREQLVYPRCQISFLWGKGTVAEVGWN